MARQVTVEDVEGGISDVDGRARASSEDAAEDAALKEGTSRPATEGEIEGGRSNVDNVSEPSEEKGEGEATISRKDEEGGEERKAGAMGAALNADQRKEEPSPDAGGPRKAPAIEEDADRRDCNRGEAVKPHTSEVEEKEEKEEKEEEEAADADSATECAASATASLMTELLVEPSVEEVAGDVAVGDHGRRPGSGATGRRGAPAGEKGSAASAAVMDPLLNAADDVRQASASSTGEGIDAGAAVAKEGDAPLEQTPCAADKARENDATNHSRLDSISTRPKNHEQQLLELQAKYDALLSSSAKSEQQHKATVSKLHSTLATNFQISCASERELKSTITKLESALAKKDQTLACSEATIASLRKRNSALEEDVASLQGERDALVRDATSRVSPCPSPPHLSPRTDAEDVSNCSSEAEELQSKVEELTDQRDAAEEQVRELLGVQLQKDELLVQLQDAKEKLKASEDARKEEREASAAKERRATVESDAKRRRMCRLEASLDVVASQRDRATSRVRSFLLARVGTAGVRAMERVLSSFQAENRSLGEQCQESRAEAAMLQLEKSDVARRTAEREAALTKLEREVEELRSQNGKLRLASAFDATFRADPNAPLQALEEDGLGDDGEGKSAGFFLAPPGEANVLDSDDFKNFLMEMDLGPIDEQGS